MERLILRSVLWGADKVPDHWFEKIPGGFYKEDKQKSQQTGDSQNASNSGKGGANSSNAGNRRHSTSYDSRASGDPRRDSGYRSDGQQRRSARGEKSMDGGADDRQGRDRQRSRRDAGGGGEQRARSTDGNRNASGDGYNNAPRDPRDGNDPRAPHPRSSDTSDTDARDGAGAAKASPPYPNPPTSPQQGAFLKANLPPPPMPQSSSGRQQQQQQQPMASSQRKGSLADGYVPYAHIYGGGQHKPTTTYSNNASSPRPRPANAFSQPPVMPSPNHYQQNPNAQLAPTAADAGAGAAYIGQNSGGYYGASIADPWRGRGRAPGGYDGQFSDHRLENSQSPPLPPRNSRAQHGNSNGYGREGSPASVSSYDSRHDNDNRLGRSDTRRAQHEHNNNNQLSSYSSSSAAVDKRSKSKSRVREAFDTSQRGLGYGAAGALAGGLVGSEVGKGNRILPVAIGAAVGALGANAFEARERRKEYNRNEQYARDGTYARAEARRRAAQGYYSD